MESGYSDALRGYAFEVHRRDGFRCVYCGIDGSRWPTWLYLSWDHLLPRGNRLRDDERYIVTACRICNEFCNRTVFDVEDKTPQEIVDLKRTAIMARRTEHEEFWRGQVAGNEFDRLYDQRAIEGVAWVERLMAAEPLLPDDVRSRLPEVPGIYAFSSIGRPSEVVRAWPCERCRGSSTARLPEPSHGKPEWQPPSAARSRPTLRLA